MRTRDLGPKSHRFEDLLAAAAAARGCATPEEIAAFLDPAPPIANAIARLPDYGAARERMGRALSRGERILLFGDFDCDGITSLVQAFDFLKAAGHERTSWFTPDRMRHDYGLTGPALAECVRRHEPTLIVALDCGSNSREEIAWLGERGIDCIVVDHHAIAEPAPGSPLSGTGALAGSTTLPALAHLNPKAWDGLGPEVEAMRAMSASGLSFLFFEQLASDLQVAQWRRDRACLLAGVGTVVDVMPLIGVNRALVKRAIHLANDPAGLRLVPGLAALKDVTRSGRVDARTFGFRWGPRLNASGRLEEATRPIECLLAESFEAALPLARECHETNQERRQIQQTVEREAVARAAERLKAGLPRVLLLCDRSWHPGIVGIVASRLRERYSCPAIVCGWHGDGYWKGSGRSPEGFDLGAAVAAARAEGLLLAGGGHSMAAGVKIAPEKLDALQEWLDAHGPHEPDALATVYELLAPADALPAGDARALAVAWWDLFDRLEPFGAGNPQPCLFLRNTELRWGPKEKVRKDGGQTWALSAGFSHKGQGYLFADWTDVERARTEWEPRARYDLVLSVSKGEGFDRSTGAPVTYHDWRIVDCQRIG